MGGTILMHFEGRTKYPTTPNGEIIWLDDADRLKLKSLFVSIDDVQARLDNDWKPYEAINFSIKYKLHDGQICYTHNTGERTFYIPADEMEKAEIEVGLDPRTIAKRLNRGFSVQEALTKAPVTNDFNEVKKDIEEQKIKQRKQEERRRRKMEEYKARKYRERKPHLFDGTPQQHTLGEYTQHLMENNIFPKVVK
ncbi:SA1788 family PVL leukocidin-associated protein [Staphylococcus shinii]|uniref:SA1788 family PVL leukocidin-associated protein n=2 Tax=Staphylococcus TaxID=1279 RepID=UPI0012DC712A